MFVCVVCVGVCPKGEGVGHSQVVDVEEARRLAVLKPLVSNCESLMHAHTHTCTCTNQIITI